MIKESITPDEAIELLNSAVKVDKEAINNLVNSRVACNLELADHPTIQVGCDIEGCEVGLLGILNGLFGIADDGWGCIGAVFKVKCPNGCIGTDTEDENFVVGKQCPICNKVELILGELIEFIRIR